MFSKTKQIAELDGDIKDWCDKIQEIEIREHNIENLKSDTQQVEKQILFRKIRAEEGRAEKVI